MAPSLPLFVTSLLLIIISVSNSQPSFRPDALVLPVRKDATTLQYLTTINRRTPLVPVNLVVHLGGQFLWVDCDNNYVSSSYRPARCRSAQCSLAGSTACGDCFNGPRPGCNNNTCGVFPDNPFTRTATGGELAQDSISIPSTDGSNPTRPVTDPNFIFSCAPTSLLSGLARRAAGIAGLGRARIGFPSQLASAFSFRRKFAICLFSTTWSDGVIFFGDGPYRFLELEGRDLSESLIYTPLYVNPVSTAGAFSQGEASTEYFIGVNAIRINNNPITVNNTLLKIDGQGNGGTKISTVDPYTVLESSIYRAFISAYIREAASSNMTRVSGVAPFDVCFSSVNVGRTRVGPAVPYIDLVLRGQNGPVWTITGSNSMVWVNENVICLGFLDGGSSPRTAIVIGGYQLEDNLLQFDLAASRLGFSSLLWRQTTCANFNFTSNA